MDPIVWMNAAVIAVGNGEAGEIEMTMHTEQLDGVELDLCITVRRGIRHFYRGEPPEADR